MRTIIGQIIQANKLFHLIKNHDSIALAISGGKDSLVMWKALDIYIQKLRDTLGWKIRLKAFHVQLNFNKLDYQPLLKFAQDNHLELEIIESNIGKIAKKREGMEKTFCSLCSKMKKAILIKKIKEQKFNKIAFGHHADDAIETLLMNMLNQGRIATFLPSTYLDRSKVYLIRPMCLCREKLIISMSKKLKLPILSNACPYEKTTQRTYVKEFINQFFYDNQKWPNAYANLYCSLLNEQNALLWFTSPKKKKQILDWKYLHNKKIV